MTTQIVEQRKSLGVASDAIFGWNLDWLSDVPMGMSSERLENPTFRGPPDPQTGLPPGWKKASENNPHVVYELAQGFSRVGGTALRMVLTCDSMFVQPYRWIRKGERLRVVIGARFQRRYHFSNPDHGKKVGCTVGFALTAHLPQPICEASFEINKPYFSSYEVVLTAPVTDDQCVFFCNLTGLAFGEVTFDRISVRPDNNSPHRRDTVAALDKLQMTSLRWPAGSTAMGYHWRRGVGDPFERFDDYEPTFHMGLCYTWGTDEYLSLCRELGIRPHIVVNLGTGTPKEAGDWAAYCADWYRRKRLAPPPMIWQVGNENYSYYEIATMDGEMYADVWREYAPRIRRGYPKSILCTSSTRANYNTGVLEDFMDPLMKDRRSSPRPDLYALHFYNLPKASTPAAEVESLLASAERFGKLLDAYRVKLRRYAPKAKLAITEWGVIRGETHYDPKCCGPIPAWVMAYQGAMLEQMLRRPGLIGLANNYSLLNVLPLVIARGRNIETTATYDFFRFWRPLFPSRMTAVKTTGDKWVSALAGRGPKGDWLMVNNRHPENTAKVKIPTRWLGAKVERLLPDPDPNGMHLKTTCDSRSLATTTLELPPSSSIRFSSDGPTFPAH